MAGDTFTEFLNLTKPEIGGSRDSWGQKINGAFDAIDTWAKATDKTAKDALSKEITTAQTVKGPLSFVEKPTFSKGISTPEGQVSTFGKGALLGEASRTLIRAAANVFWVDNEAGNAPLFRTDGVAAFIGGQTMWHTGNLTPANYFDKSTGTAQNVSNIPSFNASAIDIVRGGVLRARLSVDTNGTTILSNGDNGNMIHYVTNSGAVWTKQFGDLNTRIETRATFFANDRLATARAEYAGHAKWAGGTFTGGVNFNAGIGMSGDTPTISMFNNSGSLQKIGLPSTGHVTIRDGADVDNHRFQHLGKIWTREFGDLNDRIEARALAWANDRLNIARTEYANHAKTNVYNEFTADQRIGKDNAELQLLWVGVARWGIKVNIDGYLYFRRPDDNVTLMAMSYHDGAIYSRQFNGFLNDRIEQRAIAWADDRLNVARTEYANAAKTNGYNTFTQDQLIQKDYPGLRLLYPGKREWFIHVRENGSLFLFDGTAGEYTHEFYIGGAYRNNQIGDLNTRIEQRAAAFADDRLNTARTEYTRITGRLAYAGDLNHTWNAGGGYEEPYGGGVMTSRQTSGSPYNVLGFRWRYMQMKGTDNSWYTLSYT